MMIRENKTNFVVRLPAFSALHFEKQTERERKKKSHLAKHNEMFNPILLLF